MGQLPFERLSRFVVVLRYEIASITQLGNDRREQIFLAGEVVVDGSLGDRRRRSDPIHAGVVESVGAEFADSRLENRRTFAVRQSVLAFAMSKQYTRRFALFLPALALHSTVYAGSRRVLRQNPLNQGLSVVVPWSEFGIPISTSQKRLQEDAREALLLRAIIER